MKKKNSVDTLETFGMNVSICAPSPPLTQKTINQASKQGLMLD